MTRPSRPRTVPPASELHVPLVPSGGAALGDPAPEVYPSAPTYADLPVAPPAYHQEPASPSGRRRHRTPLAWLPWALLGALALLLLVSLLLARAAGPDDPSGAAGTGASSSLTSEGADVLRAGALRGHVGSAVTGSAVVVQSVVSDEAFWVGTAGDRVLVHLSPASRGGQAESPYQVRAGDRVDLTGTAQRVGPSTADDLGITAAEGADDLRAAGALIEARRVSLSR